MKHQFFLQDVKDHQDEGPWRSYDLEFEGETLDECLDHATYFQTDQWGGSMPYLPADDALAEKLITEAWNERMHLLSHAVQVFKALEILLKASQLAQELKSTHAVLFAEKTLNLLKSPKGA